ncbi:MAG: hypothetical protein KAG37_05855 [Flavobacteriales bacterium]|nr:hypothetical protein [Flavobacteriales bacterium]
MENIERENIEEVLKELSTASTPVEVEITTFDFETIKGIVTKFKIGEYDESVVFIEDNGTTNEIEVDFVRDLIVHRN